jgi:hypothetical protein
MAKRPLTFGLRMRGGSRTLCVRACERDPRRYVLEVRRGGERPERRAHASLGEALVDFARSWRNRLH